jgi:hypothetical protein
MMRNLSVAGALLAAVMLAPAGADAVPFVISGSNGLEGLGSFTGTFNYTPIDATHGTIDISLTNTSPAANGGFITAFVFNIPSLPPFMVDVTGATLTLPVDNGLDVVLGAPAFLDSESANPFGDFDIGAGLDDDWEGGGGPGEGIPVGATGHWQFNLEGTNLGNPLDSAAFLSTLSVDAGGPGEQTFVVRFKGFDDGGSDKVPVDTSAPVPEPGTLALVGLGLASLSARRIASTKH